MVNTFEPVRAVPSGNESPILLALLGLMDTETEIAATIIWNGAEYPCTGGPEYGGKRIDEGGFRLEAKLRITIRCAFFNVGDYMLDGYNDYGDTHPGDPQPMPQKKQVLSYKRSPASTPKTFRIDAVKNFADAYLELDCNDPNQGA